MSDNRTSQRSYDPHAYQPLAIDENCLSEEDCREALIEAVNHPSDWVSYLAQHELDTLKKSATNANQNQSLYFSTGGSSQQRDQQFEMARLGLYRAYARNKYAGGHRIWYGDGVPFRRA
jgi:hypothetical protein